MPRGSREQVLYWTGQHRFLPELLDLVHKPDCHVTARSQWMPMGLGQSQEARLDTFGPTAMHEHDKVWKALKRWWLARSKGNTPNWDIALSCDIAGKQGLILVEAKAHVKELDERGKGDPSEDSEGSKANHGQIVAAIAEARTDLQQRSCEIGSAISHERSYQLANRIAFAWKLASEGIPTVLVYLGFLNDTEISKNPLKNAAQWHRLFRSHLDLPESANPVEVECKTKAASFWVLSRTRPAVSTPATLPSAKG